MKKYLYSTAAAITAMTFAANNAFAQSAVGTTGGQGANQAMSNVTAATSGLPNFMMLGAYIMGVGLAITGLLKIKSSVENPGKEPIKDGLFRLVIGGALLALGTVLNYMVNTTSAANDNYALRTLTTLTFTK